ncbi:MAG: ABC transporter permease [Spirochaetaceae bacterium]|jgi:ABC-2 type transport system permease protein|nr:ABC transporter permease [Spirochaetaceae bacterium]
MNNQICALKAEFIKNRHSKILLISFIAFSIVPVMGGVFMLVTQNPQAMAKASLLNTKMEAMKFSAGWESLFMILTMGMGIGGVIIFGFVVSWIFGREYSEGTVKDMLSLPTSKSMILNAKFILYFLWSLGLAIVNAVLGIAIGAALRFPGFEFGNMLASLKDYFITTILTVLLGPPIAFFSLWGKGYLAPLGILVLTVVFSQIITALGYGCYFPWAVPALFSGAGGEYKEQLNPVSYFILLLVAAAGYRAAVFYWKYADHHK